MNASSLVRIRWADVVYCKLLCAVMWKDGNCNHSFHAFVRLYHISQLGSAAFRGVMTRTASTQVIQRCGIGLLHAHLAEGVSVREVAWMLLIGRCSSMQRHGSSPVREMDLNCDLNNRWPKSVCVRCLPSPRITGSGSNKRSMFCYNS